MLAADGTPNVIDPVLAREQWNALADAYRTIGFDVEQVPPVDGLLDQVFTANPVFAYPDSDGAPHFLRSRMRHSARQPEVDALARALESLGATGHQVPGDGAFEGGGDLLWKGDERRLIGGHGFRSDQAAVQAAVEVVDAPLVEVKLVDDRFYHLDTCLAVLDRHTALWVPEAFDAASRQRLQDEFEVLIDVPEDDRMTFAGNAHGPDGRHVFLDAENQDTIRLLRDHGFEPVPLATGEFRKSGGSVYCMKQVIW